MILDGRATSCCSKVKADNDFTMIQALDIMSDLANCAGCRMLEKVDFLFSGTAVGSAHCLA